LISGDKHVGNDDKEVRQYEYTRRKEGVETKDTGDGNREIKIRL